MTAAGGTISLIVGAAMLRLSLTHTYQRYIRAEMGVYLAIAGATVILLGVLTLAHALWQGHGHADHDHDHEHEEDHSHDRVGVGWLLLAPIAALLLVAPPTLGSYGVDRGGTVDVRAGAPVFHRIPKQAGVLPMSLLEYGQRAFDHDGASFNGAAIQLTGFVVDSENGGFRLARYQIACCAADATPIVVRVVGTAGEAPPRDQWVTVTGLFKQADDELPEISATSVAEIAAPEDPYE